MFRQWNRIICHTSASVSVLLPSEMSLPWIPTSENLRLLASTSAYWQFSVFLNVDSGCFWFTLFHDTIPGEILSSTLSS